MNVYEIIDKKKRGLELNQTEIEYLINGYVNNEIPDYQISAWLMAVYFQGMTDRELLALTNCMTKSGEIVDLSSTAAGDDARRAVFNQKVNQLVKRGIVDVFVLPAEGSHKREYNAAQFFFFHSYAPLRDDFGISIPIFKNSIAESKTECNIQNS